MTVDYRTYEKEKYNFLRKHTLKDVYTSTMDEYGVYHKVYVCDDCATWYETMMPEYVKQEVEVKMCKVTVEIKMFKTEFWSSDDSTSKFYYEKF